jgi:hypothetical protein
VNAWAERSCSNPCSNTADFADVRECSPVSKSLVALRIWSLANCGEHAAEDWGSTAKPRPFCRVGVPIHQPQTPTGICHQPNCSSTPAALIEAILRPMYTFCVSEGWACPSWSAMARADNPASSRRVAVVFRKT